MPHASKAPGMLTGKRHRQRWWGDRIAADRDEYVSVLKFVLYVISERQIVTTFEVESITYMYQAVHMRLVGTALASFRASSSVSLIVRWVSDSKTTKVILESLYSSS